MRFTYCEPGAGIMHRQPAPVALLEACLLVLCYHHFDVVTEEHHLGYAQVLPWMMAAGCHGIHSTVHSNIIKYRKGSAAVSFYFSTIQPLPP